MSNEIRLYRFSPDQPGKGGQADGFHSFFGREDVRALVGYHVRQFTWERDRQTPLVASVAGALYFSAITSFINWPKVLPGTVRPDHFTGTAIEYLNGTTRWRNWVDPYSGSSLAPHGMTFTTMTDILPPLCGAVTNDRIVLASHGYPYIWDGAWTGGTHTPVGVRQLGAWSPLRAPTVAVSYSFTAGDYYYCASGGFTIAIPELTTNPSFDDLVANEEVRLYHETLTSPAYATRRVVRRESGTTFGSAPNDGPYPLGVAGSVLLTGTAGSDTIAVTCQPPANADGTSPQFVGLAFKVGSTLYPIGAWWYDDSVGLSYVTFISGTMPAGYANVVPVGGWANLGSWDLQGVRVTLDDAVPGVSDAWEDADRVVSRGAPGTGYTSWAGSEAPGYAYAYYDNVTGHISNLSPITYVDSTDVVNGKIEINIAQWSGGLCANGDTPVSGIQESTGLQYVGEYASADVGWYPYILFFRTRRSGGGAVLYPIGSLDPASSEWMGISGSPGTAVGTWTDDSTDADLLISGRLKAPIDTNHRPSVLSVLGARTRMNLKHMAWWDGRLWVVGFEDPTALHYSCDAAQASMGRPEESFPDLNRLAISAGAGEITAVLTVGAYLLIVTRSGSFIVQGNHETNYRLVQISAEVRDVWSDRLCNIPTGQEGGGVFVAVLPDWRVLVVTIGGGAEEIGAPISKHLSGACKGVAFYRSEGHSKLAIVCENETEGVGNSRVWEFNFESRTWSNNNPWFSVTNQTVLGTTAVGTAAAGSWASGTAARGDALIFGVQGRIVSRNDLAGSAIYGTGQNGGYISIGPIPAAHPGKRVYAFAWARVVLVGSGASTAGAPTLTVSPDDRPAAVFNYTMKDHPDVRRRLIDSGATWDGEGYEWVCFGPDWGSSSMTQYQAGQLPTGRRMGFMVIPPAMSSVMCRIAYVEIALRELSDDGVAEP